ncbi:hypothetical protein D3C75_1265860 [compost metagenome]
MQIEKISSTEFDSNGNWIPILNSELEIPVNERKSSTTSLHSTNKYISKNTYFRLNTSQIDTGVKALGIQIVIKTTV